MFVLFDVTVLFTCDQSPNVICDKLANDPMLGSKTTLTAEQVWDLLSICLEMTYIQFNSMVYAQVEVAAMGSPMNPIVTELFMK